MQLALKPWLRKKIGVGKSKDESCWNRYVPKLEIVNQEPYGMLEHLKGLGVAQGFTM